MESSQNQRSEVDASFVQANSVSIVNDWLIYLDSLYTWGWLVLLAGVAAGLIAWNVSMRQTTIYQVTTDLLITQAQASNANMDSLLAGERLIQAYAHWIVRDGIQQDAAEQLQLPTDPKELKKVITSLTASVLTNSRIIRLTLEGPNPDVLVVFAQRLPKVFADQVKSMQTARFSETKQSLEQEVERSNQEIETLESSVSAMKDIRSPQQEVEYAQLQSELFRTKTTYQSLVQQYENVRLAEAQSVDTISVIDEAKKPTSPIRPKTLQNTLLGLVVGAMAALGLIFVYEYLTDRFRQPADVYRALGIPVLSSLEKADDFAERHSLEALLAANNARHPIVEALRRLRANIRFANVDGKLRTLSVMSSQPGEGKSFLSANLAIVMAQSGLSVILVDADLHKPKQHMNFDVPRSPGLSDALVAEDVAEHNYYLIPTHVTNLQLLTVGKKAPNPSELLGSQRMGKLIEELKTKADIVIIDTPPLLLISDSQVIGPQMDGCILIMDTQMTSRRMAVHAVELSHQVGTRLLGVVLNRIPKRAWGYYDNYGYSYGYYGGYYQDKEEDEVKGNKRPSQRSSSHAQPAPSDRRGLLSWFRSS